MQGVAGGDLPMVCPILGMQVHVTNFCDLFPGVNNAVTVNSCLVCEEGFEVRLFCKAYCFSLFSISEF